MNYLASFLALHGGAAAPESPEAEPKEPSEAPSLGSLGTLPPHVDRGADASSGSLGTPLAHLDRGETRSLDPAVARRELLAFPAALLGELPLATELELELAGGEVFPIATDARCSTSATWCASEWRALVLGAESERVGPHVLKTWLARKHAEPSWMLTEAEALELPVTPPSRGWSVERVLRQLGAVLRDVHIDESQS